MTTDKQTLLRRYRRTRRIRAFSVAAVILSTGPLIIWWLPLPLAVLAWVAHEIWFSDHHFYSPRQDYRYGFPEGACSVPVALGKKGELCLNQPVEFEPGDTLLLEVRIRASLLGQLLDPAVIITSRESTDSQAFERGVKGVRYTNLTGYASVTAEDEMRIIGRFCNIEPAGRLWIFRHVDYSRKRLLIVAPHADDAELAAFGLYSRAKEAWIVTLTAGEVETEHYRRMGFSTADAALLKGRLRAWDSTSIPRWGGVPEKRCIHFGYFCLQLPKMKLSPGKPVGSREAALCDTRPFRVYNQLSLPSDGNGLPTWENLKTDLLHVFDLVKPEVIVLPHPELDPHPDHVSAYSLVSEAIADSKWQPEALLCYANHLHDNDRWPMGMAHQGVPLPPHFGGRNLGKPFSLPLPLNIQMDKAMALAMMHDLQPPLKLRKRLRRMLQTLFIGRQWPAYGENEFFRKAVRRQELFWARFYG
jgi:LmbE family N-acetylglucosaminyl deacetylase